uniref:Gem-associated protein 2 n=1 Tax=Spongospora subterranea TaxID=70186 RepID=A0A0H5QNE8_9EUKA|eukprot:CRZ03523.1 hypothetical protein [Spongospora subterranea]
MKPSEVWIRGEQDEKNPVAFEMPDGLPIKLTNGPPLSAEEHLLQVRREAERLPDVFQAKLPLPDSSRRKSAGIKRKSAYVPMSAHERLPNPQWSMEFTLRFQQLRRSFSMMASQPKSPQPTIHRTPLPHPNNSKAWRQRILDERMFPTLTEMLILDQVAARSAVSYISDVVHPDSGGALNQSLFKWLWALLLHLEQPLLAETSAVLCSLYRSLATRRAVSENISDETIANINIILCIVQHIFGQSIPMDSTSHHLAKPSPTTEEANG